MYKIGIRYGTPHEHHVSKEWFKSIGINETIPFNGTNSNKIIKHGMLSQLLGMINSDFISRADVYVLSSTACASCISTKKGKVITLNSDTFYKDLENAKGIKKLYMKDLVKCINGIISTSYMMKDLASKFTDVPHEVVYPYCESKFKNINIDYKVPNICSIGTGISTKGTDVLVKVFRRYYDMFSNSKLFICGDKIDSLDNDKNIVWLGKVDPYNYLSKSSIYINTSRHESFGVNVLEAMLSGLPTLVTKYCGVKELVAKVNPWLICNLDVEEIAVKAKILHFDINLKRHLGEKSRKVALYYTKEKSVKDFKNAFERLCG